MYHQPSKRRLLVQRIAVYGLMTIATIGLVTVLIFIMLGYQFNGNDGKIEQGGLVQFESKPSGADVSVDGALLGTRTSTKATLTAGQHFVKMERPGYQSWQKSINVLAGSVLWLNYTRFIPNDIATTSVADFASVSSTAASLDNKWMAIHEDVQSPAIRLVDLTGDEVKLTNLVLPATSYTPPAEGKTQSFTLEKWDPTSRYVLVRHVYNDDKLEWMVVDTQNVTNTKNVTTLLGINATKLEFSSSNSAVMYAIVDNALRRVDLGATTLSGPLLTNIADFSLYDRATIAFVSLLDPATKKRTVGYIDDGTSKPRTLRSYSDDGVVPLHLQIDKYFDDTYVAISYGENIEILKGDLPRSDSAQSSMMKTARTMTLSGGTQYLSTLNSGRFVVAQTGPVYTMYDLELQKVTTTTLKGIAEVSKELHWLDNYIVWSDRDGMLRFYEFDGANQHDIMPVVPGFSAALSPSGKYVYGIAKSKDGAKFQLERARLILQ
jgi:hypothetical protein